MGIKVPALRLALLSAALSFLGGCHDPSDWEPKGEVSFVELRESLDGTGAKGGSLDYRIENVGKARISGARFSFTFSTDRRAYHQSVESAAAILSGSFVYGTVLVPYVESAESGSLAAAVIESTQFE
jgi:hypothetical protein